MSTYPDHVIVPLEADDDNYWQTRALKAEDSRDDMIIKREDQARGALVGIGAAAIAGWTVGFILGWLL